VFAKIAHTHTQNKKNKSRVQEGATLRRNWWGHQSCAQHQLFRGAMFGGCGKRTADRSGQPKRKPKSKDSRACSSSSEGSEDVQRPWLPGSTKDDQLPLLPGSSGASSGGTTGVHHPNRDPQPEPAPDVIMEDVTMENDVEELAVAMEVQRCRWEMLD
jgi:hypothetical protein